MNVNLQYSVAPAPEERGQGWTIWAGLAESPFGSCLIAGCPQGICRLSFVQGVNFSRVWKGIGKAWPGAELVRDDAQARTLARRIFHTEFQSLEPLRVYVKGTPFQLKVWRALQSIPAGRTLSYGTLAGRIGQPGASRAVGRAVGANPVAFLIPCHRVIRQDGTLGGYAWGPECKRAILESEARSGRPTSCSDS